MQLLLLLAVAFLIVFVMYAKKNALSKKAKVGILAALALLIAFAWLYEAKSTQNSEQNRLLINAFKQGKTLDCEGKEISSATFVFVSGTLSFIPNDKNQNDKGVVIDILTCKMK
ncbi:hypothetical protein [Sulfurospirillum oryzae]|uniref:hypothetical protein n=1 Tax=Sulfurospirillum oryzae TaxID=2976535 RepID=UPI0021E77AE2|nr:hypothetical protein [Sulfurospirillum oryzae]